MNNLGIKSRLLKRLDAEIAAAADLGPKSCLQVQRALLFARHGHASAAREQLTALHKLAFQHPNPALGAWLHFAEGLMSYYTDFSGDTRDKVARGLTIARSIGLMPLVGICTAWLAQIAHMRNQPDEMLRWARECDEIAALDDHSARYRLCMVVGLAHHYAGQARVAQAWYMAAKGHAIHDGDDASLSALMYNMAEMRTAQARRESLANVAAGKIGLLLGADSVKHYDAVVGGSVNSHLTAVLRAQVLTVDGEFEQARVLFESHLPQTRSAGLARLGSSMLADLAWCRVNTGQSEHALLQARESELELDPSCDVDDRAATHSRLSQVYAKLGDGVAAERHAVLAAAEWQEFGAQQAVLAEALNASGLVPR
ncbi:hypothetical protein BH11PSE10_BH11PSE10_09380 [soil metagenome]